ncbi:MAG: Flp pilus assembly protein CpaB [Candidatus Omnitrophica bacterium]|nr:Flp pilus assembly protein CpaB [Candidatus Omnitrophota bacterium]
MNIENKKQFATILLAAGFGLTAAFLTSQYVKNSISEQTKAMADAYVKSNAEKEQQMQQQIEALKGEMMQQIEAAKQQAAQQQAQAQGGAAGQNKAVRPQEAFSVRMPPGKRAVTVLMDSLSAVGGLINPGDYVDIIAHLQIPDLNATKQNDQGKKPEDVTSVLFQKIQVLAVNANFEPTSVPNYEQQQASRKLNVTLAMEPEAAALLTFAEKNGQLQFTLRAPNEKETGVFKVASWEALSDFVMENQGTKLLPIRQAPVSTEPSAASQQPEAPKIQIFKSGEEVK